MTKTEKAVVRAAMRMVSPQGWGYFGTHLGRGLCTIKKMEKLERACARHAAALKAQKKGRKHGFDTRK